MKIKQIISAVVLGVGLLLTAFSIYEMKKLSSLGEMMGEMKQAFSAHSVGKKMSSSMDAELDGASHKVRMCLYTGVILILAGGGALFYYRRKY